MHLACFRIAYVLNDTGWPSIGNAHGTSHALQADLMMHMQMRASNFFEANHGGTHVTHDHEYDTQ